MEYVEGYLYPQVLVLTFDSSPAVIYFVVGFSRIDQSATSTQTAVQSDLIGPIFHWQLDNEHSNRRYAGILPS